MKLHAFLPFRIARLAARTSAAIAQIYSERFGLTRDEWRVLAATGEAEVQPTRAIAEQTRLDKVAISRAASALEDRGFIERSEDRRDRRIKMLRLTEAGREVLAEIEHAAGAREAYLLDGLAPEEREIFERVVEKLANRAAALTGDVDDDEPEPEETPGRHAAGNSHNAVDAPSPRDRIMNGGGGAAIGPSHGRGNGRGNGSNGSSEPRLAPVF